MKIVRFLILVTIVFIVAACDAVVDTFHTLPTVADAATTPSADVQVPVADAQTPADAVTQTDAVTPPALFAWVMRPTFDTRFWTPRSVRVRAWATGFSGEWSAPCALVDGIGFCRVFVPGNVADARFVFEVDDAVYGTAYMPGWWTDPRVPQTHGELGTVYRQGEALVCEVRANGLSGSQAGYLYTACAPPAPVVDASAPSHPCTLPNGNPCSHGASCVVATCSDGTQALSSCSDGTLTTVRACPTVIADAGAGGPSVDTVTVVGSPRWTVTSFQARIFAEPGGSVNATCTDGAPSINSVCTGSMVPPFRVSMRVAGTSFPDVPDPSVRVLYDPGVWTVGGPCLSFSTVTVTLASGRAVACDRADNGRGGCDFLCH